MFTECVVCAQGQGLAHRQHEREPVLELKELIVWEGRQVYKIMKAHMQETLS